MDLDRWNEIERWFNLAIGMAAEQRLDFVRRECRDPAVLAEVERLLQATLDDESFLQPPSEPEVAERLKAMAWLIGERVGDYVIEERLGSGGMGAVFRARQPETGHAIAVKFLYPGSSLHSSERFRRENLAASRLDHPNIVKIISGGEHDSLAYYSMEYVDGWSLATLMETADPGGPNLRDPRVAARLIRDAADALHHSHGSGVIHRDIKPHNLLVGRQSHEIQIIDFGLAKLTSLQSISRSGDTAGTPLYMSPEQIRSRTESIDHRTDIYSLGAVLYELLAGVPPFSGSNAQQVLYRIAHQSPRSLRSLAPGVPRDLEIIVARAMRRDRNSRFQTAAAMRDDLDRYLRGESIVAKAPSLLERFGDLVERSRQSSLTGVASMVVLLGLGIWWVADAVAGRTAIAAEALGTVEIRTTVASPGAMVTIARFDPEVERFVVASAGSSLPVEGLQLEPGYYRFSIEVPGIGVSEEEHVVTAQTPLELSIEAKNRGDVLSDMIFIPAGRYEIDVVDSGDVKKKVAVELAAFFIDRTEVSNGVYAEFLRAFPDVKPPHEDVFDPKLSDRPVIGVGWPEASRFARWRGKRLPTVEEWKAAAMGLGGTRFPWGDDASDIVQRAVVSRGRDSDWRIVTRAVDDGGGDVSHFGVLHMFGNSHEWTSTPKVVREHGRTIVVYSERRLMGFAWRSSIANNDERRDFHLKGCVPVQWDKVGLRLVTSALENER